MGLKTSSKVRILKKTLLKYDVVVLSESKLNKLDHVEIPHFSLFSNNRENCKLSSGGITLLVKNELEKHVRVLATRCKHTFTFEIVIFQGFGTK